MNQNNIDKSVMKVSPSIVEDSHPMTSLLLKLPDECRSEIPQFFSRHASLQANDLIITDSKHNTKLPLSIH